MVFFFNDTATTEIYTLSLHDALPISDHGDPRRDDAAVVPGRADEPDQAVEHDAPWLGRVLRPRAGRAGLRSEEHTSELQSRQYLVCRLLLEKKTSSFGSTQTGLFYFT